MSSHATDQATTRDPRLLAGAWTAVTRLHGATTDCRSEDLAAAFLHAAGQGWVHAADLSSNMIPGDVPHGVEKLRARRVFLSIVSSPPGPGTDADLVRDAIRAAPRIWQENPRVRGFLRSLGEG